MVRQLCEPLHETVHALLPTQVTPLRHAPVTEHRMLQLHPEGHATCCVQPPLSAQSIVQLFVPVLHDVHPAGQLEASPPDASVFTPESTWEATQKPSVQVRPELQSACTWHAKSPLRWLTEQPPAVTITNPRTANQSATSFTACLPS
jgi:hypothetical protein